MARIDYRTLLVRPTSAIDLILLYVVGPPIALDLNLEEATSATAFYWFSRALSTAFSSSVYRTIVYYEKSCVLSYCTNLQNPMDSEW